MTPYRETFFRTISEKLTRLPRQKPTPADITVGQSSAYCFGTKSCCRRPSCLVTVCFLRRRR